MRQQQAGAALFGLSRGIVGGCLNSLEVRQLTTGVGLLQINAGIVGNRRGKLAQVRDGRQGVLPVAAGALGLGES